MFLKASIKEYVMVIEIKVEATYTGGDSPFSGPDKKFHTTEIKLVSFFLTEFPLWFVHTKPFYH